MRKEVYTTVKELLSDMDIFVATQEDGSEWINIEHVPALLTKGLTKLTRKAIEEVRDARQPGWVDQRYTIAQNLYNAAVDKLAEASVPKVTYTVSAADLYRLTGIATDQFVLGALLASIDRAKVAIAYEKKDLPYEQRINGRYWTWIELQGLLSRIACEAYGEAYNEGYDDAKVCDLSSKGAL